MSDLIWQNPPPVTKPVASYYIDTLLPKLQARPYRWALVDRDVLSEYPSIWRNKGCEVRSVRLKNGHVDIWARWIPKPRSWRWPTG